MGRKQTFDQNFLIGGQYLWKGAHAKIYNVKEKKKSLWCCFKCDHNIFLVVKKSKTLRQVFFQNAQCDVIGFLNTYNFEI